MCLCLSDGASGAPQVQMDVNSFHQRPAFRRSPHLPRSAEGCTFLYNYQGTHQRNIFRVEYFDLPNYSTIQCVQLPPQLDKVRRFPSQESWPELCMSSFLHPGSLQSQFLLAHVLAGLSHHPSRSLCARHGAPQASRSWPQVQGWRASSWQ